MYVIFEGIDTSGKSTQIEILGKKNPDFIITKEPGQTKLGKDIREIILHLHNICKEAEFFLFLADRSEHFQRIVKPNLDKTILSDRGFISGMAYAYCNDESLDLDFLLDANKYALSHTLPDKIVFFKTSKELLEKRLGKKSEDNIEKRGFDYLLRVQDAMEKIIKKLGIEYLHVNAKESIEDINKKIEGFLK
ncbi:MAG: dTMP kinase [Proteobacteria bacterium]|nr:MAG: dTMP kinase [Pseudomonadota bacterium]